MGVTKMFFVVSCGSGIFLSWVCIFYADYVSPDAVANPETHFRHQQGRERAGAITNPVCVIQNTNITVNALEHQRIVTIKELGKQTKFCSEAIKEIFYQ